MAAIQKQHFQGNGRIGSSSDYDTLALAACLRDIADDLATVKTAAPAAATSVSPTAVAAVTSSQNATANATVNGAGYVQVDVNTIVTLANALKVSYNAAQVDIVALQAELASARTQIVAANVDIAALAALLTTISGGTLKTTKA